MGKPSGEHKTRYNPFPPRIPEEMVRRGELLGLLYVEAGATARNILNSWNRGYRQDLTGVQISYLIQVDEADPEKKETSPKILDRQFGQRLRKARTGNRRG